MRELSFEWTGPGGLAEQLECGIVRASARLTNIGRLGNSITLWRPSGSGLRIQNLMHDVAERIELGVLEFTIVDASPPDEISEAVPASFNTRLRASKLTISESGATAESGIILRAPDNQEIVIVAGAHPYTLAVRGVFNEIPYGFSPEYPLEAYTRTSFS